MNNQRTLQGSMELNELRFLVVEDHAFQRTLLEQMLRTLGAAQVASVGNGKEAMKLLRAGDARFDIVITDLMMPEVDGIELIPMLKNAAHPVALVLASVDQASLEMAAVIARGQGLRVLGTIAKPVTPEKLRALIDQYPGH
jgi:CheY-like chemotaxis protein